MSAFQPGSMNYCVAFGASPDKVAFPHLDVRAPTSSDVQWNLGQRWVDTVGNAEYVLTSQSSVGGVLASNWALSGIVGGALNTITGSSGGALTPAAGTINIVGTGSQITTAGAGSTLTLSIPAVFIAPGSIAATTTLTATLGNITATNGNIVISATAKQLQQKGGLVTDFVGTGTLVGGVLSIPNTNIASTDRVFVQRTAVNASTALGELGVAISAGVSFTVQAYNTATAATLAADVSSFNYWIVRQI